MPQLDDLVELVQTVNEIYFITAPGRLRTALILVDEITELALKTFLQERSQQQREQCRQHLTQLGWVRSQNHHRDLARYFEKGIDLQALARALGRQGQESSLETELKQFPLLQHWSVNDPESRRLFGDVVNEVKSLLSASSSGSSHRALALLDEALRRHQMRDKLYHDHRHSGLTIDEERCLNTLCELFDLLEYLFPSWSDRVQKDPVVRCQVAVLRLKLEARRGNGDLSKLYQDLIRHMGTKHRLSEDFMEHSLLHTASQQFIEASSKQFKNNIAKHYSPVFRIINSTRKTNNHRIELSTRTQSIEILRCHLNGL